jgi:hypothetical protein
MKKTLLAIAIAVVITVLATSYFIERHHYNQQHIDWKVNNVKSIGIYDIYDQFIILENGLSIKVDSALIHHIPYSFDYAAIDSVNKTIYLIWNLPNELSQRELAKDFTTNVGCF